MEMIMPVSPSTCQQPSFSPSMDRKPAFVHDMDDLIKQLYDAFNGDHVDVDHVTEIMEAYKTNPVDWKRYAKFDRYKYTRNLVSEGNGKFNIMLICWGPSQVSTIHDHTDAHCFMKVLAGSLEEVRFDWPKEGESAEGEEDFDGMRKKSSSTLPNNGVCYMNDSLGLHRVANGSDSEGAVSLHLYCPPFSNCHMFDERTGKKTKCTVTFHSKFGTKVKCCQN